MNLIGVDYMTYSSNIQNSNNSYQPAKASTSSGVNSYTQTNNNTQGLYKGQQLSGEVMDLRNDEVEVRLQDGRVLNAKMEDTATLSIGDKLNFKVLDVSSSNLTLKIISEGATSSLDHILDKALDLAGLSKNSRNKEIVGELLKHQMSIDKNTINLLVKQSMTFKDTPISTLVLLNKYQFPVTRKNLKLFEDYEKNAHNIYNDLENMAASITDLFQGADITDEVYIKESKQLLQGLFPMNDNDIDASHTLPQLTISRESLAELQQLIHSSKGSLVEEFIQGKGILSNGTISAEQAKELLSLLKVSNLSQTLLPAELENFLETTSFSPAGNLENTNHLRNAVFIQNNKMYSSREQLQIDYSHNTAIDKLNKRDLNFIETFKSSGFSAESLNHITNKSELVAYISSNLESLDNKTAKTILNSIDFKNLIKEQLLAKWSISPLEFAEKEKVDNHLDSLVKDIKNLTDFLDHTSLANGTRAVGQANNLMDNLNFMNQLNHFFTYAQIPIKLNTGYTKSELYVYSKRKHSGDNNGSISVLLHLDMNNLGPLDIYVKLDKNQLDSTFYCDNVSVMTLISNHIDTLTSSLQEKDLQITTSVQARTKTVNVIKEILEEESSEGFGIRYNFDVRA